MCILSLLPEDSYLDAEALINGGVNNPDGHGWAIASPDADEIILGHSLNIREAVENFVAARKEFPTGPALFHSRFATHGSVKTDNCHPFYVGGSRKTVLGHNGILPAVAHPAKGDDRSDTKIMAEDLLPRWYARLDDRRTRQALAKFAGAGNKLLVLTVDPKYKRPYYLVNAAAGVWDRQTGVWHSNYDYCDTWKYQARKYGNYGYQSGKNYSYTMGTKGKTSGANVPSKYESKIISTVEKLEKDWYKDSWRDAGKPKFQEPGREESKSFLGGPLFDENGKELCMVCERGTLKEAENYCTTCGSCADCMEDVRDCQCYNPQYRRAAVNAMSWDVG